MTEPLISVIVPVYKVEPWLERCVNSIRNQAYRNLEIILVDDGSPDRCGEMCDQYAREDSRILVLHQNNGGLSAARNAGLDICHGEYIGFVDSDDFIHPEMYTRLYDDICTHNTRLAFCQPLTCYESSISFPQTEASATCLAREEVLKKSLSEIIWFSAWTKLYHRSLFDNIRYPEGRTNEDYPVTIRIFDRCDRIAVDFNQLYAYCKRENSITSTSSAQNAFDQILSAEEVFLLIKDRYPEYKDFASRILFSACIGLLLRVDCSTSDDCSFKREDVFAVIRKYYPGEKKNPSLSASQRILLAAANAGKTEYRIVSWLYRTIAHS